MYMIIIMQFYKIINLLKATDWSDSSKFITWLIIDYFFQQLSLINTYCKQSSSNLSKVAAIQIISKAEKM